MRVFHSSKGNNQFKLFPLQVEKTSIRSLVNGPYRKFVMEDLKPPVSDLPHTSDQSIDLAGLMIKPVCINVFYIFFIIIRIKYVYRQTTRSTITLFHRKTYRERYRMVCIS